mmetsp:Transcript_84966/g.245684  ORF Transcript_84966/g.245684 Transcript_84966/m.245684 type:complete len:239 (+) Transcript_84966:426-1142(+)
MLSRGAARPTRPQAGQTPSSPTRLLQSNVLPGRGSWHAMYINGWTSPCLRVCTDASRATTLKSSGCVDTSSADRRISATEHARPTATRAPPPAPISCDKAVRLCVAPPWDHQARIRSASGTPGERRTEPASSNEPLKPPFHSFTKTPLSKTSGQSSKILSSCRARSPHNVTSMLKPESSASVTSRFTSSLPAADVKEKGGLKLTMTPQMSMVTGEGLERTSPRGTTPSCDKDKEVKLA